MTTPAASPPPQSLTAHLNDLETALRSAIGAEKGGLAASSRYVMGWEDEAGRPTTTGGKRIRPALCLLAAEVLGGSALEAMPGAVAVELVHNFSLVHDEIQDRDAERHHRPTIWRLVGEAQAINIGDFLLTHAIRALSESATPPERRLAALNALLTATDDMIGGQWSDLSFEPRGDVSIEDYLAMVEGKTGALIGAPLQIGAILSGAPKDQSDRLRDWGRKVGLAFQVQDDILGIWGNPAITGKSNQNDLARHKKTLPVIAALSAPSTQGHLSRLFAQENPPTTEIEAVSLQMEAEGIREIAEEYAQSFVDAAGTLLNDLGLHEEEREQLATVARYLIQRAG
ncbi:MAG: dimethylallyltranstransferase [Dehalococcoidia bacterium]|nr:dimethylallyltranstransferase [Dehalococcoidia bacterium]